MVFSGCITVERFILLNLKDIGNSGTCTKWFMYLLQIVFFNLFTSNCIFHTAFISPSNIYF